ncbi:MAG: hypothetical protein ACYSTY_02970, partial [Planctomycetota bacterium]
MTPRRPLALTVLICWRRLHPGAGGRLRLHHRSLVLGLAGPLALSGVGSATTIDVRVDASSDDAEQSGSSMDLTSGGLDFGDNELGMRFKGIPIAQGSTITNAYVEFVSEQNDSTSTDITFWGEDIDDAPTFTSSANNITNRTTTTASVPWNSVPNWNSGNTYQSPDLSTIIQEIVDRPGWVSGNDLVILSNATGDRDALTYDGSSTEAPLLHVEFTSGGGSGGGTVYMDRYQTWPATATGWQVKDLSGAPFNLPADAVVEIAIRNTDVGSEQWGGVRAVGSGLERRFQIHEAEPAGSDVVVMHVQADGSSQIEHYAGDTAAIEFVLLGYWNCVTYVEAFQQFSAGADAAWRDHDLAPYGVGSGEAAEIVVANTSGNWQREGGVRTNGSVMERRVLLHEAEQGGVDLVTMCVQADATVNATIDVYAEADADVDFYLTGYWTTPPGPYTELFGDLGSPTADATWEDRDLSAFTVPADAVAEVLLANTDGATRNNMGVRAKSSSLARRLDLHESEGGGGDFGRMHAEADAASTIQFYHEDVSDAHTFWLTGYWAPQTTLLLADHTAGQESDAFRNFGTETDAELFAFQFDPCLSTFNVTEVVFSLSSIVGLD